MKHEEVRQLVRGWMDKQGFEPVPPMDWRLRKNGAHPDDVFVMKGRLESQNPLGIGNALIMEYKTTSSLHRAVAGIGQLIYYSTLMNIGPCCLVVPESYRPRMMRVLDRVPWMGLITFSKGEVVVSKLPHFPIRADPQRFKVKPLSMEEAERGNLDLILSKLG